MMNYKHIRALFVVLASATILTTSNLCADKVTAQPVAQQASVTTIQDSYTLPIEVVNAPDKYLNKTVTLKAKFDKFSTLGLDYKSAFKSSEEYISFLVKRDDTIHDIPLSELKLFLKRDVAEKFIDLKSGDEVAITGTVFSKALGDAWIDVSNLTVLKKVDNNENKDGVK